MPPNLFFCHNDWCLFVQFDMATNTVQHPLTCGVCSNHYSNPLMMPCLHSFCSKCLEQQLEEQGSSAGSIKCPTCDTISPLPSGGVSSLPSNLWLAHQVEVSSYQHKMESGESIPCERCVKPWKWLSHCLFCCNCCLFLCSTCKNDHTVVQGNRQSWTSPCLSRRNPMCKLSLHVGSISA